MKICEMCSEEIYTRDGDNRCQTYEDETSRKKRAAARHRRKERDQIMRDCGLVKARGALGGTYYE